MAGDKLRINNATPYTVKRVSCTGTAECCNTGTPDSFVLPPGAAASTNPAPHRNILGIDCGVFGHCHFEVQDGDSNLGGFRIDVELPVVGDGKIEVEWDREIPGISVALKQSGRDRAQNAPDVQEVVLNTDGIERHRASLPDEKLNALEAVPVVGLGIAAAHAIAGAEDEAKRATIASGASTLSTVAGVAAAGAASTFAAAGVGAAAAVGALSGAASGVVGKVAEHTLNDLQDSEQVKTAAGGWEGASMQDICLSGLAGAAAGGLSAGLGAKAAAAAQTYNPDLELAAAIIPRAVKAATNFGFSKAMQKGLPEACVPHVQQPPLPD